MTEPEVLGQSSYRGWDFLGLNLVFILPTSNASVERGFSQTKMFLESRESLSLKSAEILKNVVLTVLDQEGLKMKNLLAVSRDNPNVSKRLVKLLKEEANAKGSKLIDPRTQPLLYLTWTLDLDTEVKSGTQYCY